MLFIIHFKQWLCGEEHQYTETPNISYLTTVLIKMRLLIFLVSSRYGLACKCGIIFQISIYNWMDIAFSDTLHNNCLLGKAKTKTWFNLLF